MRIWYKNIDIVWYSDDSDLAAADDVYNIDIYWYSYICLRFAGLKSMHSKSVAACEAVSVESLVSAGAKWESIMSTGTT